MFLVAGIPTPLKNMLVSWNDDIPNIWESHSKFHGSSHHLVPIKTLGRGHLNGWSGKSEEWQIFMLGLAPGIPPKMARIYEDLWLVGGAITSIR